MVLNLELKNFRKSDNDWATPFHAICDVYLNDHFVSTYSWNLFSDLDFEKLSIRAKVWWRQRYSAPKTHYDIWRRKVWNKKLNESAEQEASEATFSRMQPIYPDVYDVESCLVSDAQTIESCLGFEDFCADFGYSSDSRKAEKIYNQCKDIYIALVQTGMWEELKKLHEED